MIWLNKLNRTNKAVVVYIVHYEKITKSNTAFECNEMERYGWKTISSCALISQALFWIKSICLHFKCHLKDNTVSIQWFLDKQLRIHFQRQSPQIYLNLHAKKLMISACIRIECVARIREKNICFFIHSTWTTELTRWKPFLSFRAQ